MPRIKIKQLEERVATQGLHMGGTDARRKLQPGEVVEISDDEKLPDGTNLLDLLWSTGKIEMVLDEPTRPLDYLNYREAQLCAPTFKPRDPSEENEMHIALDAVAARMAESKSSDTPEPPESPVADTPAKTQDRATRRRAAGRRATARATRRGETAIT